MGLWLPGDPRFLRGRRRCPGVRRASGDSVRFEASGKLGKARGGAELSPQPQGVSFPTLKRIRNPCGRSGGRGSRGAGRRQCHCSFERDPKERGLNYIVKMKMPPEGVSRAAVLSQVPRAFRAVSLFGWQGSGGGGRAAMWIGEEGAGTGKGRGPQDPAAWGRLGLSHPRQGARHGSHLNPGEQANDRGAGREGNGVK